MLCFIYSIVFTKVNGTEYFFGETHFLLDTLSRLYLRYLRRERIIYIGSETEFNVKMH